MSFDPVSFRASFPQFNQLPDLTINTWADLVSNSPMGSWFGTATVSDQMLMVAHVGFLFSQATASDGAPGGAVTSAGQGSISASFAAPPVSTGLQYYLSSSPYGRMLWANLEVAIAGGDYVGGLPERRGFRKVGGCFS